MIINSDINVLGGLPDINLVNMFYRELDRPKLQQPNHHSFTHIKTSKSIKRFEFAIKRTLLTFNNDKVKWLFGNVLMKEGISDDSLLILFWNASFNNYLFNYLNSKVFFPAYYSGRLVIKQGETLACLKELKTTTETLKKYSESTLDTLASKYLTFLRKLKLLDGTNIKKIKHTYLSDLAFMHFFYWILAIETKSNILESSWLPFSFCEKDILIERLLQKKYNKFIDLTYTGDRLTLIPIIDYKYLYNAITKP